MTYKEQENIYLFHIRVIKLITSYHPNNKLLVLTKSDSLKQGTISNFWWTLNFGLDTRRSKSKSTTRALLPDFVKLFDIVENIKWFNSFIWSSTYLVSFSLDFWSVRQTYHTFNQS